MTTNGWQKALLDRDQEWDRKLSATHKSLSDDIKSVATTLGKEISDLAVTLNGTLKKEPPQYPLYQIGLYVLVVLGGIVYLPIQLNFNAIKETNTEQNATIRSLTDLIGTEIKARGDLMTKEAEARNAALAKEAEARNGAFTALADRVASDFITRREFEAISARGKEERDKTAKQFETLQANVFPKDVHTERWNGFTAQLGAIAARLDAGDANLQREIDGLQKLLGDQFTARDALLENKERISKLEEMIRDIISKRVIAP